MIKNGFMALGFFVIGIVLAQVFGWWILFFVGMIAGIFAEN